MRPFTTEISADTQVPNSNELGPKNAAIQALRYKPYRLSVAVLVALLPFAARSAENLKIPADYRSWYHVNTLIVGKESPLFEVLGGMHIIHVG